MGMNTRFPPGFRFHPTDQELVMYYLKRKVLGKKLRSETIAELNIYDFEPSNLPDKAAFKSKDQNWFFFCPRAKRFATGPKANRATGFGYWKATGIDRSVNYDDRAVGKIKTLIFHRGKPPKGERTDWVMHEYRLDDHVLAAGGMIQDTYVLCKVYCKSGFGPKNGEQYGAPFVEEEWDDDLEIEHTPFSSTVQFGCHVSVDASAGGLSGIMVNGDISAVISSEVAPSLNCVNQPHAPVDAGDVDQVSSKLVCGENQVGVGAPQTFHSIFGDVELDKMLDAFVEELAPIEVHELPPTEVHEVAPTELQPADCGNPPELDIFNQLDDLGDWKKLSEGGFLSVFMDSNMYLKMDDLN